MASDKIIVITRDAKGKETKKELLKSKKIKLPKGKLMEVQAQIIKLQQEERKNEK